MKFAPRLKTIVLTALALFVVGVSSGFSQIVANYLTDYSGTTMPSRWEYLWNAPTGWTSSGTVGDLTSNPVGLAANYRPLLWAGASAGIWTADGTGNFNNNPGAYTYLGYNGGGGGYAYALGSPNVARGVAVSYSVLNAGYYQITSGFFRNSQSSPDGQTFLIHLADGTSLYSGTTAAGAYNASSNPSGGLAFDGVSTGYLAAGSKVYFTSTGNHDYNSDGFFWDFNVTQVPEPSTYFLIIGAMFFIYLARPKGKLVKN